MASPVIHPAALDDKILLRDCDIKRLRRSGPGGQHRNKVETAVVIRHRPTGIEAEANERRSQAANQQVALFRLRVNLALHVRTSVLGQAILNELWKTRCRNRRISINPNHADFPALLAYLLDLLSFHRMDLKEVAETLECTSSQLIKFLKMEPRAFGLVNMKRVEQSLHRLQ